MPSSGSTSEACVVSQSPGDTTCSTTKAKACHDFLPLININASRSSLCSELRTFLCKQATWWSNNKTERFVVLLTFKHEGVLIRDLALDLLPSTHQPLYTSSYWEGKKRVQSEQKHWPTHTLHRFALMQKQSYQSSHFRGMQTVVLRWEELAPESTGTFCLFSYRK